MLESIKEWFAGADLGPIMEHLSNDRLIEYATHPIGIGIAVAIIVFTVFMKWKIMFVSFTGILAGIFVVRYTITETGAPNASIFLFIGGAVILGGFIIYFTLVSD